jgi:hypothetical protein
MQQKKCKPEPRWALSIKKARPIRNRTGLNSITVDAHTPYTDPVPSDSDELLDELSLEKE